MGAQAWPDEKSAQCFALLLDGLSFAEIAKRMGITRSAVSGYVDRHGGAMLARTERDAPLRPARPISPNDPKLGGHPFEIPKRRENDDHLHLTLLLAALREQRAA